jgi:hypothetical protein
MYDVVLERDSNYNAIIFFCQLMFNLYKHKEGKLISSDIYNQFITIDYELSERFMRRKGHGAKAEPLRGLYSGRQIGRDWRGVGNRRNHEGNPKMISQLMAGMMADMAAGECDPAEI